MPTVEPKYCGRRCALTIDHTKVNENGTYAVLFDGSGGPSGTRLPDDLFASCQSNGGDICFADYSDGTGRLNVDLVWVDTAAKRAEVWVSVPSLSTTTDRVLWVFYKSNAGTLDQPGAADSYGSRAVYSAVGGYAAVWHLAGNTTDVLGNYSGTTSPTDYSGTPAVGKNCAYFSGARIAIPTWNAYLNTNWAVEYWSYMPALSGYQIAIGGDAYNQGGYLGFNSADMFFAINAYGKTWTYSGINVWAHNLIKSVSSVPSYSRNGGTFSAGTSYSGQGNVYYRALGAYYGNTYGITGYLSQVRFHTQDRTSNWSATNYNMFKSTSAVSVGPAQLNTVGPTWRNNAAWVRAAHW